MKDESKRGAYDLIYPSITRSHSGYQSTPTPRPPPASAPRSEALSEAAQIAALQKSKQERGARWRTKKNAFDLSIFELQRGIRRLEQEIKNLTSVLAAEAAAEAQKNSWGTWLLSPIYKKAEDTEEIKARKDRERQERRIEKDMKERRLDLRKTDLEEKENRLKKAKNEVDAADLVDEGKIQAIEIKKWARESRERQEREKVERERLAKIWKQQQAQREQREREAAEVLRKQYAEQRAAQQKRQEEENRRRQKILDDERRRAQEHYAYFAPPESSTRHAYTSTCRHDGWWPKVQGRADCPECNESWTYLLQCPSCEVKACPRCQSTMRPRRRTSRREPSRMRTPSPTFYWDYD